MDELRQRIEEIAKKYAECVDRLLEEELKKEDPLTTEELVSIGNGFSLLNHAMAAIERTARLQNAGEQSQK